MKKFIASLIMMAMLAIIIPFATTTANAQRKRIVKKPNVYQRHRNLFNVGIGTAAGAILGGIIGGGKGALIGAGTGAGGTALYTYKMNPKN